MSDEIREDTLGEASDADTLEETQNENGAVEKPSLIFGKYKDMEAAENGVKERERKLHEQAERIKFLEEQAELKSAITELAKASAAKNEVPDNSAELLKARLTEIADDYREQPEVAVEKQAQLFNAWIADEGNKVKSALGAEIAELKQTITGLQERVGDMNPDYIAHKETVDQLVKDGMPKAKAIEWAKKMNPEREETVKPSSMNGAMLRGGEKKGAYLSEADRAQYKSEYGLTDEDLDAMERDAQARAKTKGRLL